MPLPMYISHDPRHTTVCELSEILHAGLGLNSGCAQGSFRRD